MPDPLLARIVREALENAGRVDLGVLVAHALPVAALRALAQRHGLSPKGFRIERTPAVKLAPLLLDPKRPDVLEETCRTLLEHLGASDVAGREPAHGETRQDGDAAQLLALRTKELNTAREELERLRASASDWRDREAALQKRVQEADALAARARADLEQSRQKTARRGEKPAAKPSAAERRVREVEKERDELLGNEGELRRLLALRQASIRDLHERVAELMALVPTAKLRKAETAAEPVLAEEFRLPYFQPSFYKSFTDKDRRAIEQAVQAALLFCTEGPSYPGLEVKQIEGQDLWSLRASIKLRVYFRFREDGGVDFLEVADREDQHTALRRLKER